MSNARTEQQQNHRNSQIIAALWSVVFLAVIWFGYYLLFSKNVFLALVLASVLAVTAWSLARFVGSHDDGLRRYWPMFAVLLTLSAVGVFNSLMLNLEGRQIFTEAIDQAEDDFTKLDGAASRRMTQKGVGDHLEKVRQLESALVREVKNPLNCGQGPQARRLIAELKIELPGFVPLSSSKRDCTKNDVIINDYRGRIQELVEGASWNDPFLRSVRQDAQAASTKLQELSTRSASMFAPGLLSTVAPELSRLDAVYRADRAKLSRDDGDVSTLPSQLDLSAVNSLGEWSQLPRLIGQRLDHASTYLYFILAIAFDFFMVYCFKIVRQTRPTRGGLRSSRANIGSAW